MSTNERTQKPWQGRRAAPRRTTADVVMRGSKPLAQITIYRRMTLLTRQEGNSWRQYPIDPEALGQVFAQLPRSAGLLPPQTLTTGMIHGKPYVVLYIPPQRQVLRTADNRSYDLPLPPLVWGGWGTDYRIWSIASETQPTDTKPALCVAPFPNCYRDGGICWGSSDGRPDAAPRTVRGVLDLFLTGSLFNAHVADGKSVKYPRSVLAMWAHLVKQQATVYPVDDLMPAERGLDWLVAGGPWHG